ncbi:MAG: hypothetical protein QOG00_264 [Pyrinomonadaceae bacterium]|nr:hypothetical protein [Pyrinomonadaceae bacterium]
MRVEMIYGVFFNGKDLLPGETHTVPDYFGMQLVNEGRARQISEPERVPVSEPASLPSVNDEASPALAAPAPVRKKSQRG